MDNDEKAKLFEKYMEGRQPYGHSWDGGELFNIWKDGWDRAIEAKLKEENNK